MSNTLEVLKGLKEDIDKLPVPPSSDILTVSNLAKNVTEIINREIDKEKRRPLTKDWKGEVISPMTISIPNIPNEKHTLKLYNPDDIQRVYVVDGLSIIIEPHQTITVSK